MKPSDLLIGTPSLIYASSLIIVILILMFFMSLSLFLNRRKKAYFSLTISLFIVIIQHLFLIIVSSANLLDNQIFAYMNHFLKSASFILVNMGIYQLYNSFRNKQYLLFNLSLGLAFVISLFHFSASGSVDTALEDTHLLHELWLDLYLFLLLFICYYVIAPRIGQSQKYQIGLAVYFFMMIADVMNRFMFENSSSFLAILVHFLPVLYYGILFVILFERVVELLQASYTNSITDGLTGLYNRRYFMNRVNQYINHGIPVSIIFSDIDNFKKLNDTKGHQKGDEVLRHVAMIMKEAAEEVGLCGRFGGEEMVILVTDPESSPGDLAENVRMRVEKEAGVTVSVGYSKYRKGLSGEMLLKQADEAMYMAKTTGKNKVVRYVKINHF